MTAHIAEAIADYWGERCSESEPGCPCCDVWAEFDKLIASRDAVLDEAANFCIAIRRDDETNEDEAIGAMMCASAIHSLKGPTP